MHKNILVAGIVILFVLSALAPITFGSNVMNSKEQLAIEDYKFERYLYPEYYDCYNTDEIPDFIVQPKNDMLSDFEGRSVELINSENPVQTLDDLMDSPWPMYCHDVRHTGRSPYNTSNNPGTEKWRFGTGGWASGSPVIGEDGIIYMGAKKLHAIYPNGTLKWEYDIPHKIVTSTAIDENGIIYVGTIEAMPNYLYAIYSSNGTLKWKYPTGEVYSSPTIGADGSIYVGTADDVYPLKGSVYAINPDGTQKWRFQTNHLIFSSPAIGLDGIIYCGCHDGYLYALYPNNGTLKWKYHTGDWVARGPSIADDGTIYFGSWDGYLYAVNSNGSLKWKTGGYLVGTTPVTAKDGTIYVGNRYLSAIYPNNGSVKWAFNPGSDRTIRGGNPCISADGIIYLGTHIGESDGGELISVNSDGTERWRIMLATDWIMSAPAIGEDSTIYIGSVNDLYHPGDEGYLHAIGELDINSPSAPTIDGKTSGKPGKEYEYTFKSTSPLGRDVYYYIEWGDNTVKDWFGPFSSGEEVKASHAWFEQGTYTIRARAKDTDNIWGPWGDLVVTIPRNKAFNSLFMPILQKLFFKINLLLKIN